jgi:alkaline phosphatase D
MRGARPVQVTDAVLANSIDPRKPPAGFSTLPDIEAMRRKIGDPARQMLGVDQEAWVANEMMTGTKQGTVWTALANQTMLARFRLPDLRLALSPTERADLVAAVPAAQDIIDLSRTDLPLNLDAWDGYPAARARLLAAGTAAAARLVTLTGDIHSAFACSIKSDDGTKTVALEFVCTSITSPGLGAQLADDSKGQLDTPIAELNADIDWCDLDAHGFTLLRFEEDAVRAEYHTVSTVLATAFETAIAKTFVAKALPDGGIGPLEAV